MAEPSKAGEELIVGNFQCQMHLSDKRTLTINGYFYSDDTQATREARLNEYQDLIDRQFIRTDLVNKEAQRAALRGHIEEHRVFLEGLAKRKADRPNGAPKMSSQQLQQLQTGEETVRGMLLQIEKLDAAILEGKRRLGTAAA